MLRTSTERAVRLSGGLAVLLLLAAEERVCPWLFAPLPERSVACGAEGVAGAGVGGASPSDYAPEPAGGGVPRSKTPKRLPLTVAETLPDALHARWGGLPARDMLQEHVGRRNGVYQTAPARVARPDSQFTADACSTDWQSLQQFIGVKETCGRPEPLRCLALMTAIHITGPPVF